VHRFLACNALSCRESLAGHDRICRMSALLVAGIPDGDRVIELLDDLPHRGDSTTIALIVGGRTFRLRLPQPGVEGRTSQTGGDPRRAVFRVWTYPQSVSGSTSFALNASFSSAQVSVTLMLRLPATRLASRSSVTKKPGRSRLTMMAMVSASRGGRPAVSPAWQARPDRQQVPVLVQRRIVMAHQRSGRFGRAASPGYSMSRCTPSDRAARGPRPLTTLQ
jgi:hypothetical protein